MHAQREEGNIGETFRKIFGFVGKFCRECEMLMQREGEVGPLSVQKEEEKEKERPREEPRKKMSGMQSETNFQRYSLDKVG
jgi:hypothetical protein